VELICVCFGISDMVEMQSAQLNVLHSPRRRMATWVNYLYPRERHAPLHILSGSPGTKGSKLLKVFLFSGSESQYVSVSVSVPVSVSYSLSVSVSLSAFPLRGGVHSIVA